MLNAINVKFKLPIGYALINKLNGLSKADFNATFVGVNVVVNVVVFNGDPANISMAEM